MKRSRGRLSSQRGAVLIHVAIALLGLVAFTTFVTDYGIMWVARGQIQTAADAGALAGATALAFDSSTDFTGAKDKARAVALANDVFGAPADVQLADITFPACPPGSGVVGGTCVKVNAFRNQARNNPLPMFFGHVPFGTTSLTASHGVVATATAMIIPGKLNECLKPWAVIDRWDEYEAGGGEPDYPNPDPDYNYFTSTFDKYSTGQGKAPPPEPDLYVPPSGPNSTTGTGFRLPADYGSQYIVKMDDNTNDIVSPGWFRAIVIPRVDGQIGGNTYRDNIKGCGGLPTGYAPPGTVCPTSIGNDDRAYWAERGCYEVEPGNKVGPTRDGVDYLMGLDPGATWSTTTNTVTGSSYAQFASPRIVPIGVIDIDHYLQADPSGRNGIVRMVNIFGFFLEGYGDVDKQGNVVPAANGKAVIGRIMTIPALEGTTVLPNDSAFLKKVILVR
jgi:Flp pilus assembly protein TadG